MSLIHCLFAISAADDSVSSVEDKVTRQIADELLLEHSDYIEIRARFRDYLEVLKKKST
jgi:uncharacterized tellurite resistance protein B-like protein